YLVRAQGDLPRSAQGRPVLFQAGASPAGQDFAARTADVVFSPHGTLEAAAEFRRSIVERTVAAGRAPGSVKTLPGAEIILAATAAEAEEKVRRGRGLQGGPEEAVAEGRWLRARLVGPARAPALPQQCWGRDVSAFGPEAPLPGVPPEVVEWGETRGAGFQCPKAEALPRARREEAAEKGHSILE